MLLITKNSERFPRFFWLFSFDEARKSVSKIINRDKIVTTEDIQEEKQIEKIEENQELEETKPAEASENIQVEEEVKAEKPPISLRKIDRNALTVVKKLRAAGFEALLTGGCVRDLLLGMSPKDFDVATSAKPDEVKKLIKNCRLVGRRFL